MHAEDPEKVDRVYKLDMIDGEALICLANLLTKLFLLNQSTNILKEVDALFVSAALGIVYLNINLVPISCQLPVSTRVETV